MVGVEDEAGKDKGGEELKRTEGGSAGCLEGMGHSWETGGSGEGQSWGFVGKRVRVGDRAAVGPGRPQSWEHRGKRKGRMLFLSTLGQRNRKASRKLIFMLQVPASGALGGCILVCQLPVLMLALQVGHSSPLAGWEDASWCLGGG